MTIQCLLLCCDLEYMYFAHPLPSYIFHFHVLLFSTSALLFSSFSLLSYLLNHITTLILLASALLFSPLFFSLLPSTYTLSSPYSLPSSSPILSSLFSSSPLLSPFLSSPHSCSLPQTGSPPRCPVVTLPSQISFLRHPLKHWT